VALGLLAPYTPFLSGGDYAPARVNEHGDERGKFYRHTGLLPGLRKGFDEAFPDHWWAVRARAVRLGEMQPHIKPGQAEGMLVAPMVRGNGVVAAWMNIGLSGFYAGPEVHIVDAIGLSDPLLARLPARFDPEAGAGHFGRIVPEGYLATLISGEDRFADRRLGAYYAALLEVVRGDLLSRSRLLAIWAFNTGAYDDLLDWPFYRHPSPLTLALSDARMEPLNPANHIRVAAAYFKRGDDQRAIDALNEAISTNPSSFFNFAMIGQMLDAHGHPELAASSYRQALHNAEAHRQHFAAVGDSARLQLVRETAAVLRSRLEWRGAP